MVRSPKLKDFAAIHAVEAAAFGREDEALLVENVRAEGAALVELVVGEEDGQIVGHILFSRMTCEPMKRIAGLAPVAVLPDAQSRGWGQVLCRAGIEELRRMGAEAVVVLGHVDYYPRFGFSREAAKLIASPYAHLPAFMAMELVPGALAAPIKADYPRAFGA